MRVIEQTDDKFVVELDVYKLHWWQKIYLKIYDWCIYKLIRMHLYLPRDYKWY